MDVDEEVELLVQKIRELGTQQADGSVGVSFGVLFNATVDIFEALNWTLRTAKKRKLFNFEGQMLLKGASDNIIVKLTSATNCT
jgi:hypothetical protein